MCVCDGARVAHLLLLSVSLFSCCLKDHCRYRSGKRHEMGISLSLQPLELFKPLVPRHGAGSCFHRPQPDGRDAQPGAADSKSGAGVQPWTQRHRWIPGEFPLGSIAFNGWMVYFMGNPIQMDDLGVPWGTPISGNLHI